MQARSVATWLTAEGGPLLIAAAGLAALVYGFATGEIIAVTLGGFLIAFAVVLPRLVGPFKLGTSGIEGNLRERVVQEVQEQGEREGLSPNYVQEAVRATNRVVPEDAVISRGAGSQRIPGLIARGLYEELEIRECPRCGEFGVSNRDGKWKCRRCGARLA